MRAVRVRGNESSFVLRCLARCGNLAGAVALDLAGGAGRHSVFLANRGATVICADIDRERLRSVRQRKTWPAQGSLCCVQMNAEASLPFPRGCFDLVLVVHYYVPGLLPRVAILLKPGGQLILETFGGHGGNWVGLPKPGEVASDAAPFCNVVAYDERALRAHPDRVTVRAMLQRHW